MRIRKTQAKNIIGKRFGSLIVESRAPNQKYKSGKNKVMWLCKCDCGETKEICGKDLRNKNGTRSCGCSYEKVEDLIGKKLGLLTIISRAPDYITKGGNNIIVWNCRCECGKEKPIYRCNLKNTYSCGCNRHINGQQYKYSSPLEASIREVFYSYLTRKGKICEISFEEFYYISQLNCLYCNIEPSKEYNKAKRSDRPTKIGLETGTFKYNGIDRINSVEEYTLFNVAPCCSICNFTKLARTVDDFLETLQLSTKYELPPQIISIDNKDLFGLNRAFDNYEKQMASKNLKNILTKEIFYSYAKLPCFYCGHTGSNKCKNFIYNGIDRLNNKLGYIDGNMVPCCKFCNFGKSDFLLEDFLNWKDRIAPYQKNRNIHKDIFNLRINYIMFKVNNGNIDLIEMNKCYVSDIFGGYEDYLI